MNMNEIQKNTNKYKNIHVLFRRLAEAKIGITFNETEKGSHKRLILNEIAKRHKDYWKKIYKVESLTELKGKDLDSLENVIYQRILSFQIKK